MARSSAKRVLGTLFFVAALVAFLAFLFVLFADAENLNDVPGAENVSPVAIAIAVVLGVIAILLLLLLLVRSYDRKQRESDEAEAFFVPEEDQKAEVAKAVGSFEDEFASDGDELVVYDLAGMEPQARAWGGAANGVASYHFPRRVDAGVYANDYIDIAPDRRLKLRTLLAGPRDLPGTITIDEAAPKGGFIVPEADEPEAPVEELPGDDFMSELEDRYRTLKDTGDYDNFEDLEDVDDTPDVADAPAAPTSEVFYDYHGDVHDVIDVEGIGPVYAEKLRQVGVETTSRLCYEDAEHLAESLGTDAKRVRTWQHMAELMKVSGIGPQYAEALARAGIEGIADLKKRSAAAIANQVNEYLDGLESVVLGSKITERRVAGWQEAAKPMRRVRSKVPEA